MKPAIQKMPSTASNPFLLASDEAYAAWREAKLNDYPENAAVLRVEVNDPRVLSKAEHRRLLQACRKPTW